MNFKSLVPAVIIALWPFNFALAQALFGAWANPDGVPILNAAGVEALTENLESAIGRNLALHMHYYPWHGASGKTTPAFPDRAMVDDANPPNGTAPQIPVVTWKCGNANLDVASGADDQLIINTAQAVKGYGKPIFIRWYWEMNLAPGANNQNCMGAGGPSGYIQAWQHIYNIFKSQGVTNIAWLWNPAGGPETLKNSDPMPYYPGSNFIDWIGFDGYDGAGTGDFGVVFGAFYKEFGGKGKPILVAETGEKNSATNPSLQATFLALARAEIEGKSNPGNYAFPMVKGFMYFDRNGPAGRTWAFNPLGLAAFKAMGADPFFAPFLFAPFLH